VATQIEKFRHSPEGRTVNAFEKLRQMASASMRAYIDGPDTRQARRRIVVDYLNTTPLAGRRGFGEVHGLGDGLWAWYGLDVDRVGSLLRAGRDSGAALAERAGALKAVLSLLLAQRRPSYYLVANRSALRDLTDSYLRLLARESLIGKTLAEAAVGQPLPFHDRDQDRASDQAPAAAATGTFVERKAANSVRGKLMSLLGLDSPYELDRLDLIVETSLDGTVQEQVTAVLTDFARSAALDSYGLRGPRLLGRADPGDVVYSVTLYERGKGANYLRVQAETLDRPFDLNEGAKLDLGSTAKLRTLITYLQIVADLHGRLSKHERHELDAIARDAGDPLTRWVARRHSLARAAGDQPALEPLLEAAMERRYSASPSERFYTGGGVHRFANFRAGDNGRVPTVREAFRDSINLPFIRLMRDIVLYHIELGAGPGAEILTDSDHPGRQIYLEIFADSDGSALLRRYLRIYGGDGRDAALSRLVEKIRPSATRLTALFRSTRPEAGIEALGAFLADHAEGGRPSDSDLRQLYQQQEPGRFSLADRAFIAGVHPLELWLVTYLQDQPEATLGDVLAASAIERQAALGWLFRTKRLGAQNLRIRTVLERDAFKRIHRSWRDLGYPFERLVPSLATAIGSSADRPSALAELIGIVVSDGLLLPTVQIDRLHFAAGTPYETELVAPRHQGRRVLPAAVAATLRRALVDVVDAGTARRVSGAFAASKTGDQAADLVVGGKTGTGDNRYKRFSKSGRLLSSQAVNRTATFVFFIGERFFGTVTAFVDGPESDRYAFTSSLPVQVLKALAPTLRPLVDATEPPGTSAAVR